MEYSSAINGLLNHFCDASLWQLTHHARELTGYRQELSGQWDDSAASEINVRYLEPHQQDEHKMREWLDNQNVFIGQLSVKLDEVALVNAKIGKLSGEIARLLSDCDDDLRKSITSFDHASNCHNTAEVSIPSILRLLRNANKGEL